MSLTLKSLKQKKDHAEFKSTLQKTLKQEHYFSLNRQDIVYFALKCITDLNVRKTKRSIEEKSKEVLVAFYDEGSVSILSETHYLPDFFLNQILDINGDLPITHKRNLESIAKKDLQEIDHLISHYNTLEFIQKNLKKAETPRNHNERTILEFYNRTLKKRSDIIDYILFKLNDRAIDKSQDWRNTRKPKAIPRKRRIMAWDETERVILQDFPYRDMIIDFTTPQYFYKINFERLDYRKINVVINKLYAAPIKCDLAKGYSKAFYTSINKLKYSKILNRLCDTVKNLPIVNARHKMFLELRQLFLNRNWYGFYALALPQIEGIFTEMTQAASIKRVTGALTDKVQQIRPFYSDSEYSFDYYEYYLPIQRNQFSHTGRISDAQKKCKILLIDLLAIVNIFGELKSSIVQAKKIIEQGVSVITDIGKLSNIIHLVEKIKDDGLFSEIEISCNQFIYVDLPVSINFPVFIKNLETDFETMFDKYNDTIKLISGIYNEEAIDIMAIKGPNLNEKLSDLQVIHDKHYFMFQEELKLILDTHYVMANFSDLFPLTGDEIKNLIDDFKKRQNEKLKILSILNRKLKINIPDDFFFTKNELTHNLGNSRS